MTNVIPISNDTPVSNELVDFQIHLICVLHKEVTRAVKRGVLKGLSPEGVMSLLLLNAASVAGNVMLEEHGPLPINIGAAFASARDVIFNGGGAFAN